MISPNGGPSTITGKDKPYDITRLLTLDKNTITIHQPKCACVSSSFFFHHLLLIDQIMILTGFQEVIYICCSCIHTTQR